MKATLPCSRGQTGFTAKLQSNLNNQPKGSWTEYYTQGFTAEPHRDWGEGRKQQRAKPHTKWLRSWRNVSAAKPPPSRSKESQPHAGTPTPEQQRGEESPHSIRGVSQVCQVGSKFTFPTFIGVKFIFILSLEICIDCENKFFRV